MNFKIIITLLFFSLLISCKSQKESADNKVEEKVIVEEVMEPKFNIDEIRGYYEITLIRDIEFNEITPTIGFDGEGELSGYNGCNSYFGTLKPTEQMVIGNVGSTRMACEGEKGDVERMLMEKLKSITNIEVSPGEGTVKLFSDEEVMIKGKEIKLEGSFMVTSIQGKNNIEPIEFTVSEGSINGFTGCNTIGGELKQNGYSIDLSEVFITEKACEGFDMQKEANFMQLFSTSKKYKKEGDLYHFYQGNKIVLTAKKI
ncbi:MAG: META domain-containing protein [Flavobacteriales bacterium]